MQTTFACRPLTAQAPPDVCCSRHMSRPHGSPWHCRSARTWGNSSPPASCTCSTGMLCGQQLHWGQKAAAATAAAASPVRSAIGWACCTARLCHLTAKYNKQRRRAASAATAETASPESCTWLGLLQSKTVPSAGQAQGGAASSALAWCHAEVWATRGKELYLSHFMHDSTKQPTPTRSPGFRLLTLGPTSVTMPTISWPGTMGKMPPPHSSFTWW